MAEKKYKKVEDMTLEELLAQIRAQDKMTPEEKAADIKAANDANPDYWRNHPYDD